jgi:manganese/zinc/iron transport system substrate-binding protein
VKNRFLTVAALKEHGFLTVAALLGCVVVLGCSPDGAATSGASGTAGAGASSAVAYPIKVTATTGMVADIVRHVGGAHCAVTQLMGPGVDPHLYKVSPGDVRALDGADIIFYNGLLLEGKMQDLFVKMARKKVVHPVAEGIPLDRLREPPEFAGHYDPHVWFDVSLWMHCVEEVRKTLTERDAAHAKDYAVNAERYAEELKTLHAYAAAQIGTIPKERRLLVTAHDAFGYFGAAYDMEVKGIQGISTESQASVKDINVLIEYLVSRKVKAVFVESSVSEKNVRALVEGCSFRGHAITVGGQLFSDAMGAEGTPEGNYVGMVRHNVDTIVSALR